MNVEMDSREYGCEFGHVQIYVDSIKPLAQYKEMETMLNSLSEKGSFDPFSGGMRFLDAGALPERIEEGRKEWASICEAKNGEIKQLDEADFTPASQDLVEQLIVGLGWRLTAQHVGEKTRSVLVTSQDAKGIKMVITTKRSADDGAGPGTDSNVYDHFDPVHLERYSKCHNGFQGIAVLGFELPEEGALEATLAKYQKLHPGLVLGVHEYKDTRVVTDAASGKSQELVLGSMKVLETFAYYKTDKTGEVDKGTVLRFVYRSGTFGSKEGFGNPQGVLPGLEDVPAVFNGTSIPAYADHWVSNVTDRKSFLDTLQDVLGFTPKVDFNAGVVAAGRARIESTVTGNNTAKIKSTCDTAAVLRDQSQIYLPINNALSDVGHVHFFLEQIGQGVQHLASRVKDLVGFIERVNNYRKMTGRGLSFLNIPRSYYGRLGPEHLTEALGGSEERATELYNALVQANLCTVAGIIRMDICEDLLKPVFTTLEPALSPEESEKVIKVAKMARYNNLWNLLRDHFDEKTYLKIVENKILVDIQNQDVLFQIFTCNITQRDTKDEAPFLEFIQRVCSQKCLPDGSQALKPGCGGFGIRNFLTLFLSIEVSKAMDDVERAVAEGDKQLEEKGRARVALFTRQLEESNPILTTIADAMTAEGEALEALQLIKDNETESKDAERVAELEKIAKEQGDIKLAGNKQLQDLSDHYSKLMAEVM